MPVQVEKWGCFEFALQAPSSGNPFLDVDFSAEFVHEHRTITVAGFYDGDNVYKVRFMPDIEGSWRFVTHSTLPALDHQRGELTCVAAQCDNHGPVRVSGRTHFAYADGTSYIPVGTTCYVWNHQGEALETQTLATLKDGPFNKMRMCVFPKRYSFNENEPPDYPFPGAVTQPWDRSQLGQMRNPPPPPDYWDFERFNPAYFRRLERHILEMQALGIEVDLILFHPYDFGAWGFDRLPAEVNQRYLRYLIARIAAFRNLWWSFANEYDLMFDRSMADWDETFKQVQDADPYDHLRSVHNCVGFYDHRKPWVTHCSIQHQNLFEVPAWIQQYGKPVVVDECGYEGDIHMVWGSLSAEEMVLRHWLGFTAGGYVGHGETYWSDDDVLWWAKGGVLHGESAPRLAFLRQVFEAVPAPGLTPIVQTEFGAPGVIREGGWNKVAAGSVGTEFYLFYFGMHQPRFREFDLPEDGHYWVDLIDTWDMTVERLHDDVGGTIRLELPRRKYLAVRIEKNG